MKTAIVMEVENGCAVVMKNGGEFVTMRAEKQWKPGDVVILEKTKAAWSGCHQPGCEPLH